MHRPKSATLPNRRSARPTGQCSPKVSCNFSLHVVYQKDTLESICMQVISESRKVVDAALYPETAFKIFDLAFKLSKELWMIDAVN